MAVSRQGIAPTQPGCRRQCAGQRPGRAGAARGGAGPRLRGGDRQLPRRHGGDGGAGAARRHRRGRRCLSIAGPSVRLGCGADGRARRPLQAAAEEIGAASRGSRFFSAPAATDRRAASDEDRSSPARATASAARPRCGSPQDCAARGEALELVLTASGRKPAPQALLDRLAARRRPRDLPDRRPRRPAPPAPPRGADAGGARRARRLRLERRRVGSAPAGRAPGRRTGTGPSRSTPGRPSCSRRPSARRSLRRGAASSRWRRCRGCGRTRGSAPIRRRRRRS